MISFAKNCCAEREREKKKDNHKSTLISEDRRNTQFSNDTKQTLSSGRHESVCVHQDLLFLSQQSAIWGRTNCSCLFLSSLKYKNEWGPPLWIAWRKGGYSGRATAAGVCHSLGGEMQFRCPDIFFLFHLEGKKTKNVFLWWKPELSHFLKGSKRQFVFFQSD